MQDFVISVKFSQNGDERYVDITVTVANSDSDAVSAKVGPCYSKMEMMAVTQAHLLTLTGIALDKVVNAARNLPPTSASDLSKFGSRAKPQHQQ